MSSESICSIVVSLTLLYIYSEAVIPAPYQVRGKLRRESVEKRLDSPVSGTGHAKTGLISPE